MTAGNSGVPFPDRPPRSPVAPSGVGRNRKRRLFRAVSQDELRIDTSCKTGEKRPLKRANASTPRCVSEFSKALSTQSTSKMPPNLLNSSTRVKAHVDALRLEADLYPMRLLLSRLMGNITHNKKGLFNHPVDTVALGLTDYDSIITKPMDLGTVKRRLHGFVYKSRTEAADEIRLVFQNAMRYNPPNNYVHVCAKELLAYFEECYTFLSPCVSKSIETSLLARPMEVSRKTFTIEEEEKQPIPSKTSSENADQPEQSLPIPNACNSSSVGPMHISSVCPLNDAFPQEKVRRRRSSFSSMASHPCHCHACQGRTCEMCKQGCLKNEPFLMVCQGRYCHGAKIRKGAVYYTADDGNLQYCEKCHTSLPPVLSRPSSGDVPLYKNDLLKRKNDEEIVEDWLTCSNCDKGVHAVCAMHNSHVHSDSEFICPSCKNTEDRSEVRNLANEEEGLPDTYTFVSGSADPVRLSKMGPGTVDLCVESIQECSISSFIQKKVRGCVQELVHVDKTLHVRVISDCSRQFSVPDVVQKHFRMATESDGFIKPPNKVGYQQKAIALFQKIDGVDVCVFIMYVHEYDGDDQYECNQIGNVKSPHKKRVYIAYLDSVEYFRPRQYRTQVYHEILNAYLATARERGYETAQIWACPPSRGNSFVFWNHPASQRTPTRERLISWYHDALSHSLDCGVVTDVKSFYESDFENKLGALESVEGTDNDPKSSHALCPPLLDGDFWIEEAVRLHDAHILRNTKIRSPADVCVWHVTPLTPEDLDPCPAMQVATLIKDRVMTHPSSVHFRRPVNAAALKLKDYHKIIKTPMDLGTIYSRCVIGEYEVLREVVDDVNLMVQNAKKYNPVGHFVHVKAGEVLTLFFQELNALVKIWEAKMENKEGSWTSHGDMSMSLNFTVDLPKSSDISASVVIEDDRSSDGSRSTVSSSSLHSSPTVCEKETEKGSIASSEPVQARLKVAPRSVGRKRKNPPRKLDLFVDGSEAVMQKMVGDDLWLLEKRKQTPAKHPSGKRKRRRRHHPVDVHNEESLPKKHRQSWLGEAIGISVRNARASLFTCSLSPKREMSGIECEKFDAYQDYVGGFVFDNDSSILKVSPITETRQGFLELSQFRHFEFNTLRRAKYSTAMLIYHIRHADAPGIVPICTSCKKDIQNVRWHKVKSAADRYATAKASASMALSKAFRAEWNSEELCECCHKQHKKKEEFIPIPVSLKHA